MTKTELPDDVRAFFVEQGSRGGKIGGRRRMERLTPAQRTELARKAVAARIKKAKAKTMVTKGSQRTSN